MGDWWIDESPPTGPYEDDPWESLRDFGTKVVTAFDGLIMVSARQVKAFENALGPAIRSYITIYEPLERRSDEQIELEKADVYSAVPIGTHEKLLKQFGLISERETKRQIGRGNVAGHGPRAGSTFGRGGKRRY